MHSPLRARPTEQTKTSQAKKVSMARFFIMKNSLIVWNPVEKGML
jgi:hypothetical protein